MTVSRGFAIVVAGGIAFATGGGVVGYALARLVPSYYRVVFRGGDRPDFDPVSVGVGLGGSQGFVAGLIGGSIVVLAVALSARRSSSDGPAGRD